MSTPAVLLLFLLLKCCQVRLCVLMVLFVLFRMRAPHNSLYQSQQHVNVSVGEVDNIIESPFAARRLNSYSSRRDELKCLICDVTVADIQYDLNKTDDSNDIDDDFLICMTTGEQEPDGSFDQVYRLDQLPKAFVKQYKQQLYSGKYRICIPKGRANRVDNQVVIPNATDVELMDADMGTRNLVSKTGDHTILVVRVTSTAGEDPGLSVDQLRGTIFGTGPKRQAATLRSQYAACSQGKLTMRPATGNNVVNGVLDIQHSGIIAGGSIVGSLQTAILLETKNRLGITDLSKAADHILYCMPGGSEVSPGNSKWIAFSYLNKWLSFFQNGWCQRLTAQVHEVGHQMGFRHSGKGKYQYGDFSCIMGASYGVTGRPQMCFNGHKNWYSGWFDDQKVTVDPISSGAWVGNVVAFVDVPQIREVPKSVAIINVGDLFIELNTAKKYNYQVVASANKLTVVQNNASSLWSNFLIGLGSEETYTHKNFSGTGIDLVIDVCRITTTDPGDINFAKVSLYLNDGVQTSKCPTPLTISPTPLPSAPPTPTKSPTQGPSSQPTESPTPLPSQSPTPLPTPGPTPLPTQGPTPLPTTLSPTDDPTSSPTSAVLPLGLRELNLTAPEVIEYPEGYCFSERNTVNVFDKGVMFMRDLAIGDLVMTSDGSFNRIYSFGHYQKHMRAEYVQLYVDGIETPLEISKDHLLFVERNAVPASNVNVGDRINVINGVAVVTKIRNVVRNGAYAPFTTSGTIVVSGVKASSYVTLQPRAEKLVVVGYRTPISMHWLAHIFQSPHRMVCSISSKLCKTESYSPSGISNWVEGPLHFCQWLLQQNGLVMVSILIPALIVSLLLFVIEILFLENTVLMIGVLGLATMAVFTWSAFLPGKYRKG